MCGACWAHSVIETIESMAVIQNSTTSVPNLSVQQMIDCSKNNHGCEGGDTCNLLQWLLMEDINIESMEKYPSSDEKSTCKIESSKTQLPLSNKIRVKSFTCERYNNVVIK